MQGYSIRDLFRDFGTTTQCLMFIAQRRWPNGLECRKCERVTRHHLCISRRTVACQHCGSQVSPTAGTIFHSSNVPLPDWFYVVFQFAKTKTGIAAKQIQRELDVSYPTALRMCKLIRACLKEEKERFKGVVEVDETYMGNKRKWHNKRGRGTSKQAVFGIVEKGGGVIAEVVPNTKRETVIPILEDAVEPTVEVQTDEYSVYKVLPKMGYRHDTVKHKERQYVKYRADGTTCHLQAIEGFWSYPKNAIKGVHRGVSDRHLQGYIDEYTFRYSHRKDDEPMFFTMLDRVLQAGRYGQAA